MTTYKKSIDFEPENYLKKVLNEAAALHPNFQSFSQKASNFLKRGIELEYLSLYYKVVSFEDILELDKKVRQDIQTIFQVKQTIPFVTPRSFNDISNPIGQQPYILPTPYVSPIKPLDVRYMLEGSLNVEK